MGKTHTEHDITYTSHTTTPKGKGDKKKLLISAIFYDHACNIERVYNYPAILQAIESRKHEGKLTHGLEHGLALILADFKKHGIKPPETKTQRKRRQRAFLQG